MHINACSVLLHRTGWLKPMTISPPKSNLFFILQSKSVGGRRSRHRPVTRPLTGQTWCCRKAICTGRGPNTQRPGSNMSGRCASSQYPSIHGGLREHYDPTDTLTGVDGRICEVGDTAAGLWNEYGWSCPAAEGQTVGR